MIYACKVVLMVFISKEGMVREPGMHYRTSRIRRAKGGSDFQDLRAVVSGVSWPLLEGPEGVGVELERG